MKYDITMYPNEILVIRLFGELDHHETEKVRAHISKQFYKGMSK